MKTPMLVLCAALAFGAGAVSAAQEAAGGALGNAPPDETTLVIGDPAAAAGNAGTAATAPDGIMYFLRMLLVLAVVLGAMYLVLRMLRRFSRPKTPGDAAIRVLSTTSLGSGRSLHLVSLGEKAWIVGSAEGSISMLAPVEEREIVDGLLLKASQEASVPRQDFQALLGDFLRKRGRAGLARGDSPRAGGYLSKQRDRLRKFREPGP